MRYLIIIILTILLFLSVTANVMSYKVIEQIDYKIALTRIINDLWAGEQESRWNIIKNYYNSSGEI